MAASTVIQVLASPLLKIAFDSLRSFVDSEFSLISGANDEFNTLLGVLSTTQDVIEDAEVKQLKDRPIRNWLRKLKDVTYDVEDFLDECNTDAALRRLLPTSGCNNIKEFMTGSVPYVFCFQTSSTSRRTVAKRVRSFIHQFEEIAEQRRKFHLNPYVTAADVQLGKRQQRETSSYTDEPTVYGREEDKEYLVNLLQNNVGGNDRQQRDVSVVAIVGMGGLGKTTLAQMVYHDKMIADHFEVRCWICVSDDFSPTRFVQTILKSLGEELAHGQQTLDYLQSRLQEKLDGKRFLVVFDDVWNEDQGTWATLKASLSCGGNGSFIVVTTRLPTIASIMATLPHYFPGILSEEVCWTLFKQRAFMCDEVQNYPELEAIGREIVKKCCGIPLAAKALGGLLRLKREQKQWLSVKENQIWELQDNASDAILPALQLSYKHLSSQLKQCFAYCSIYPKDYLMEKEQLIFLWMANGFIQSRGTMDFEDVGSEIFNELSWRSFFQDFEKDEDGNIISCKMHDLMHDLACSVMNDECLFMEGDSSKAKSRISCSTRYVSLQNMSIMEYSFLETMLHIREFRLAAPFFGSYNPKYFLQFICSNITCLRVLNLEGLPISTVPKSIGNLKHLRYLNLSLTKITSLPNNICCLINLQILKLYRCRELTCLPRDTRKMANLRHLDITGCLRLTKMPIQIGKLIFLQTLGLFVMGEESGCDIAELEDLKHLKGDLQILGLEHVKNETDARNSNLILKYHIQSLGLRWFYGFPDTEKEEQGHLSVGEGLQPHPNLKRLSIFGYSGLRFPHWIGDGVSLCLPNLVEISLRECHKCEHLPQLGDLPLLRILKLSSMDSLKCISEFYHHGNRDISFFPSLQELYISNMRHFGQISSPSSSLSPSSLSQTLSANQLTSVQYRDQAQVSSFPCLRILTITGCPVLGSFISLPPSLDELVLNNTHEELLLSSLKQSPSSLAKLNIEDLPNLVSFLVEVPEMGRFINLTHLSVRNCPKLETLHMNNGLRHLASLRELRIRDCPELEFSKEDDDDFRNVISLWYLELDGLDKMTYLPPFPFLTSVAIYKCSGITTLQEWLPSLTSLQRMSIIVCKSLESLSDGLQPLTALERLTILGCQKLKSLPDEGLEGLTALRYLMIKNCHPDLQRQCKNEEGHYWEKISHIPELLIG